MSLDNDVTNAHNEDEINNEKTIAELERKIQELRRKKNMQEGFNQFTKGEKVKNSLFVATLIILSLLPPLYVMLDRWFKVDKLFDISGGAWCKSDFLCSSRLPYYFSSIFLILGLVLILMIIFAPKINGLIEGVFHFSENGSQFTAIDKRQLYYRNVLIVISSISVLVEVTACFLLKRFPGWELFLIILLFWAAILLSEKGFNKVLISTDFKNWLQKTPLYGTIIFSLVAITIFLKETTSFSPQKNYLFFIPLLIAGAALIWQRKKINKVFWLVFLALFFYSIRMSSWRFSFVGDEYSFYYFPLQVISHQPFAQIMQNIFNVKGVYEVHPYFSSLITYVSMLFSGKDYFGWHISNIVLIALTIPLFYDFFKSFLGEKVAFIAVIPLVFSHYLVNFSKVGYNNLQSLFVIGLIFWVANRAVQKRSFTSYFLLGLCLGGCFYTFALGIYFVPLVGLFLIMFDPLRSKSAWGRYLIAVLGFALIMLPILFQPVYWQNMAGNTTFFKDNHSFVTQAETYESIKFILHNLLYMPFAYLYSPGESHFVVSSLVDPLLAFFVSLGFILSIINISKNRFFTFLVIAVAFEMLIMSITNPYETPPMTRMFVFMPFYYVFVAVGLDWLVKVLAGFTNRPANFYTWVVTCVMIAASILNIVQSTLILDKRTERYPIQSILLRLFQHDALAAPDDVKKYLFLTDNNFAFYFFETFVDVFGVPDSKAQLDHLIVESPEIPENWLKQINENEDLVVIVPYSEKPELITAWQPLLVQSGKSVCDVKDKSGSYTYYQLWYSQKYPNLCTEAQSNK